MRSHDPFGHLWCLRDFGDGRGSGPGFNFHGAAWRLKLYGGRGKESRQGRGDEAERQCREG